MSLRIAVVLLALSTASAATQAVVTLPASRSTKPLDGRLLLLLSTDPAAEPRFQISEGPTTQLVFGMDVDDWKPSATRTVNDAAFGWPVRSLSQVKPGDYYVQALLAPLRNVPPRRRPHRQAAHGPRRRAAVEPRPGQPLQQAGQSPHRCPKARLTIALDQEIPPIPEPKDTKYIRHIQDPERAADEVLGPAHVSGGAHPAARGLRRTSGSALPARSSTTGTFPPISPASAPSRPTPT